MRKIFEEKITATKLERTELNGTLEQLRKGDTIVIYDLTRLGRLIKELFKLVKSIEGKIKN